MKKSYAQTIKKKDSPSGAEEEKPGQESQQPPVQPPAPKSAWTSTGGTSAAAVLKQAPPTGSAAIVSQKGTSVPAAAQEQPQQPSTPAGLPQQQQNKKKMGNQPPYMPYGYPPRPMYGDFQQGPFQPQMPYFYPPPGPYPMMPGPPPPQGPPQQPAFQLPTAKVRTPIKIVNPLSKEEIKLPTPVPVTIKAPSTPSKESSSAPATDKPAAAPVLETPVKKTGIVLKNPNTGEILLAPKSTPVVISKPPPKETSQTPAAAAPKVETPQPAPSKPVTAAVPVAQPKTAAPVAQPKAAAPVAQPKEAPAEVSKPPMAPIKDEGKPAASAPPPGLTKPEGARPKSPSPDTVLGAPRYEPKKRLVEEPEAVEEGEIVEYLPEEVTLLKSFDNITYPSTIKTKPFVENGVIKYPIAFLLAFQPVIKLKPKGILSWKSIYGAAAEMTRSHSSSSLRMSRQPSERGARRGGSRGGRGKDGDRVNMSRQQSGSRGNLPGRGGRGKQNSAPPVAPLVKGENAWGAKKVELSVVEATLKTLKGYLNKLTLDTFGKLSAKIVDENIDNEEVLQGMIDLICEKAIDEPHFASIYAMLCQTLFLELPKVQNWVCPTDKPQDNLFRKMLLKRCQEEFEKDAKWAADDAAAQQERAALRKRINELSAEEKQRIAEEDYERGKLKRRVLGNIRFVGELFLQGLISESVIHRCIVSLLKNIEEPEEEDVESLCKLVTATGKRLDHAKAVPTMDTYFERMKELSLNTKLSSRVRFLVMDVLDLRRDKWNSKSAKLDQAKSIAQVKKEIEQEERAKAQAAASAMSRGKSQGKGKLSRADRDEQRSKPKSEETGGGWTSIKDKDVSARVGWGGKKPTNDTNGVAKLANSFGALQASESPVKSPVSPVKPAKPQMEVMEAAWKDYRESLEASEFFEDIADVDEDAVIVKLSKNVAQLLLDQNGRPALKLLGLLSSLFFAEDAKYSSELFLEGIKQFFAGFDDDRSDFPKGFANVSAVLNPLFVQKDISFEQLLDITKPIASYAGRKPVLPDFLADFLKSSENIVQFFVDTQFDIKPFFPEDQFAASVEKWIQMKRLNEVAEINTIVAGVFTEAGYEVTEKESYRFLNRDIDEELLQNEQFGRFLSKPFLTAVSIKEVFNGDFSNPPAPKTKDLYIALKAKVTQLKPILDYLENPMDLLFATEEFCLTNSITYLMDDLFRIFYQLELITDSVFFEFEEQLQPETAELDEVRKWFKYLAQEEN